MLIIKKLSFGLFFLACLLVTYSIAYADNDDDDRKRGYDSTNVPLLNPKSVPTPQTIWSQSQILLDGSNKGNKVTTIDVDQTCPKHSTPSLSCALSGTQHNYNDCNISTIDFYPSLNDNGDSYEVELSGTAYGTKGDCAGYRDLYVSCAIYCTPND